MRCLALAFSVLTAVLCPGPVAGEAAARSGAVACAAPSGTGALLSPETKIIVLGEYHGTNEMPRLTGEVACAAAVAGRPVTVALEFPASEQAALSSFLTGKTDANDLLTSSQFWREGRDGRNSVAMLTMLGRLRELRESGFGINVLAADTPHPVADELRRAVMARIDVPDGVDAERSFRDLHMAYSILEHVEKNPPGLTIFLVGNVHARREAANRPYLNRETGEITHRLSLPAAAALPRDTTLTLLITHSGGTAFAYFTEGPGQRSVGANEPELREPMIVLSPFPKDAPMYNGRAFVGRLTASPPAALSSPILRGKP